ncbi:TonB-dependent receptor [Hyphococcus sp. DH-69]|uniref:TonB-dependent receptor n=1 Tax=Hyphococcus formosus TaxID=3143534 RepID=UPI00398B45A8
MTLRRKMHVAALLAGVSAISIFSWEAYAQEEEGAASAQSAHADDVIVVTARRREERLQDVPGSVTAVSSDQLTQFDAVEIGDIQSAAPNLVLHEGDAQNTVAYIRGVGQLDSLAFADPGVGIYLDDVYLGRAQGAFLDVFDVERIEVLRGPQGTLYGRNTIGGAIKFVSRQPSETPEAYASVTYGNYDRVDVKAGLSGPIAGDKLLGKAAVAYLRRDGYSQNTVTGEDDGDKDTIAWRASLLAKPTDRFSFELSTDGSVDKPDTSRTPARETAVFGAFPPNDDPFVIDADFNDLNDLKVWGLSGRAVWELSDTATLTSISAYREMSYDTHLDLDATAAPLFGVFVFEDQDQFSQELQLSVESGDLAVVSGLYFFREHDITESGIFGPDIAFISNSLNDQTTRSYAAYTDASYDVTDRFSISAGLRLTYEEKDFARIQEFFGAATPLVPPLGQGLRVTDVDVSEDFFNVSPRATLSYDFTDSVTGYASVSRGFKSGGFDGRSNSDLEAVPFDAETLWAYEAGLKGSFYDNRLSGGAAFFYNDYSDLQVSSFTADPNNPGNFAAIFTNAASARIYGFELEAVARPVDGLRLDAAVGYLDAEYQEFIGAGGLDVSDVLTPANSPKWTARIGTEFRTPITQNAEFVVAGAFAYRGDVFPTVSSSPVLFQESYALYDASAGFEFADGRYAIRAVGKNLSDERYRQQGFDLSDSLGYELGYYGAPRTWSITASVRY